MLQWAILGRLISILPPGLSSRFASFSVATGSRRCSNTSPKVIKSNEPLTCLDQPGLFKSQFKTAEQNSRASLAAAGSISTPTTCGPPSLVISSEMNPVEQPHSSTVGYFRASSTKIRVPEKRSKRGVRLYLVLLKLEISYDM